MKVFYSRTSTEEQNSERQLQDIKGFDYVFNDTCSGSIEFFKRPKGSQVKELIDNGTLTHLEIHSIDRLGRNTLDVLRTWQQLTELGIRVICRNPNLTNFKSDGSHDEVSEMIISILSIMAKFERTLILQRQAEGIRIAKEKGLYRGRKVGTVEDKDSFLNKPDSQKILLYLGKGYKYKEISKIVGCSYSTINKVKSYTSSPDLKPSISKPKLNTKDVDLNEINFFESKEKSHDSPQLISSIILDQVEDYDCSKLNVWGYRSAEDIRDGINIKFGNMCNGFPFEINGVKFHNSECAYIAGAYARKGKDSIRIQQLIASERNGMKCKRVYRNKPEFTQYQRNDFYDYNVQWMFYVIWQKTKGNQQFADLLAKIPIDTHIVENTSYHKGATAAFWGAKNPELMSAREEAENDVSPSSFKYKYQIKVAKEAVANSINDIGHYRGKNVMGKIIKLCSLALTYGQEPEIDYELLRNKNLYLVGKKIKFPGR